MGHEDSDITDKLNPEPEGGNFNERDYSPWGIKKKAKFGSKGFNVPEKIPFSWFGIGVLILLILALGGTLGIIVGFDNRLKKLEEKVPLKYIDDKVAQIREQTLSFEQLKERLDQVEASMTLRMDNVINDLNSLQKKIDRSRPIKIISSSPAKVDKKVTKNRYHTVRRGESLYKISRMHGLTVKKIRMINKLSDSNVIHPGQKLLVGP
ncbi:MAG: LysM domain-containing protein [Thermodesulfobacteriota bacterium]|nr:LysM domain-containing protein [Thermodesulfobacteriota bacterium]